MGSNGGILVLGILTCSSARWGEVWLTGINLKTMMSKTPRMVARNESRLVCLLRQQSWIQGVLLSTIFQVCWEVDYLTLRNGFINVHLAPGSKFNFQKYIKRSLEDDFKIVVGVSPVLWASFVVYLLLNVRGWHALFWASLVPVIVNNSRGAEHRDDEDDSVAKIKAAKEALEAKQNVTNSLSATCSFFYYHVL
ncbi:hypothetical protein ERO13_D10G154100v2 [Gossypium hirsutum]|nr:hypothetical protein ERO13_D10G154100v2 [Gossypium hirsutum]